MSEAGDESLRPTPSRPVAVAGDVAVGQGWQAFALSPALGVEIRGVDLREPLGAPEIEALRRLFDEYGLLLFRGQRISEADQLRVCAYFRPVVEPVAWVSNVEPGFHPEGELLWHCDYAFTPHPMLGLALFAIELAPGAAPTEFANNARACAALSAEVRAELAAKRVVHMIDSVSGRDNIRVRIEDVGGESASTGRYPRHARPAIWRHPVTGVPLLFVLAQQASHFEGESCGKSDPLLEEAFRTLYAPENVYRHEWRVGDFAVWDNLMIQHGRRANPNTVRRSLRRVAMNTVTTAELISGTGFDPAARAALRG
jgi:taurine dioxygenase